jgi:hypothetical protein
VALSSFGFQGTFQQRLGDEDFSIMRIDNCPVRVLPSQEFSGKLRLCRTTNSHFGQALKVVRDASQERA